MSRSVPWRNKPTNLITQMLPVASEYKLYLVHETGPTSFVFKDDNDNKFRVRLVAYQGVDWVCHHLLMWDRAE